MQKKSFNNIVIQVTYIIKFTIADHTKINLCTRICTITGETDQCTSQIDCTRTANANCTKY